MKSLIALSTGLVITVFSNLALAQIQVTTVAETEVTETNARGEQVVKRTTASSVVPGTEVIYTITATNTGSEAADNIVVTNPIPPQTVYVDGSASGANTVIMFSVDGGNSYDMAAKLTIKNAAGVARPATAADYTHVRWTFGYSLDPGQKGDVWYRTRVK